MSLGLDGRLKRAHSGDQFVFKISIHHILKFRRINAFLYISHASQVLAIIVKHTC